MACLRGLTFELSRHRQENARAALQKMYTYPAARPWCFAVGARLERGVRPRWCRTALLTLT